MSLPENPEDVILSDDEFEALEALLVSDSVPADCMNLEMLDGYLAAIAAAPRPIPVERWMPAVWSADDEDVSFGSAGEMQEAIRQVLRYHNELVLTLTAPEGWEPFCYAPSEADEDAPELGDEWAAGFEQGLACWGEDWDAGLSEERAEAISARLEAALEPWANEDGTPVSAGQETRLGWLEEAAQAVREVAAGWDALGQPGPVLVEISSGQAGSGGPGRNEPCPCGSGKKYKKCCGALN